MSALSLYFAQPFTSCPIPVQSTISCNDMTEACGDNPDVGYTANHVPEASVPLDDMYETALIDGDDVDVLGSDFSVNCTLYLGECALAWLTLTWLA